MSNLSLDHQINLLKQQIDESKYDVYVDSYPMSLLELITLYKEGDIYLKADYQRVFKWTKDQKTKFIESLFLGLPIPPIFLYQDENALWEVVDGIQRLSTIFEFVGILKKNETELYDELELSEPPKLTHLNSLKFNDLPGDLQREFKKFKLDLIIISKKSKKEVKLEVFRRLNGFGTTLNEQELRNALIILMDTEYFKFIERLSNLSPFLNCFNFKEDQLRDKKHYEYVIRYLILREKQILLTFPSKNDNNINELFDKAITEIIDNKLINIYKEEILFGDVFNLLEETLGDNSFKKFYHKDNKFKNQVRESIFEVIIPGLAKNIDFYKTNKDKLLEVVKSLYLDNSEFETTLSPNPRAIERMKKLVEISEKVFDRNE